ncbi:bifunctional protein-disulfide isomerase/oxidoreductase DsbC [Algibacillus agarilyticus]|uniref:bifunctional protein-disulfide isomerase/oxidoreductase DsbC n=1 Tax=Algibacillus agarilyticus TaxID=2234133 RepID=UPI000DD06A76|nr:bifunctional protein-disulfide isomerase/oxidoreductase DsbC [Algibacillus agarilyticus]
MFKVISTAVAVLALSFSSLAVDKATEQNIHQQFMKIGMMPKNIEPSPVKGLLQVTTEKGLFYFSEAGNFLVHGTIYNMDKGMKNETESVLSVQRKSAVNDYSDSMIEFKAKDEKYVVNVFTDISCGYCRKLHNEMADYNNAGITVRYLAFPRGGVNSKAYNDMVSIWCADEKQTAMTNAKTSGAVVAKSCDSPVSKHYELGGKLGVNGTPAIILQDGSMIPGYKPAADLLKILTAS